MKHNDKPSHQRWLYQLAEKGLGKAILIICTICLVTVMLSLLLVKSIISHFE